jgi:hypothetical protein
MTASRLDRGRCMAPGGSGSDRLAPSTGADQTSGAVRPVTEGGAAT